MKKLIFLSFIIFNSTTFCDTYHVRTRIENQIKKLIDIIITQKSLKDAFKKALPQMREKIKSSFNDPELQSKIIKELEEVGLKELSNKKAFEEVLKPAFFQMVNQPSKKNYSDELVCSSLTILITEKDKQNKYKEKLLNDFFVGVFDSKLKELKDKKEQMDFLIYNL